MHDKAKDAVEGFVAGRVSRRELIRRLAVLGVGVGVADMLVNAAQTQALAADFDWMAHKGTKPEAAAQQASLCRRDDRGY